MGQSAEDVREDDGRGAQRVRTRLVLLVAGLFAIAASLVQLALSSTEGSSTSSLYVTYALAMILIAFLAWQATLTFQELQDQNAAFHKTLEEREELTAQLSHSAFHDTLTDLVNRERFNDRVSHALTRRSSSPVSVAVLLLDLDDFKTINESLGHAAGDDLLIAVAKRIRKCLRPSDTASRLGADEFVILLEDIGSVSDAKVVVDRVTEAFEEPFVLASTEVSVKASIGIATNGDGSEDPDAEALLSHADAAMYVAKRNGKAGYEFFEPSMKLAVQQRLSLRADLQRAITREEFFLVYQPVVDLGSGRVMGAEALVRWEHPMRGIVPPLEFIPLAEETGLILQVGEWVLREACREAKAWETSLPSHIPKLHVNVNVSQRQLQHPAFVEMVRSALVDSGLDGTELCVEITESLLIEDSDSTVQKLNALKELGVQVAIDDFGTGYSSLSYLRRFPIDILKIDRSFIQSIERGVDEAALAQAIVQLSQTFRMSAVAEGVELAEHHQKLLNWGCESGQGFRFSEPLSAIALTAALKEGFMDGKLLTRS